MKKPTAIAAMDYHDTEEIPDFVRRDYDRARCQGACVRTGECGPSVKLVRVCGWGWFSYCDTAIAVDLANGLDLFDEHDERVAAPTPGREGT